MSHFLSIITYILYKTMIDYIYIADIVQNTTVDGPGFRTSIYSTGCNHFCRGCHNKSTWKLKSGIKTCITDIMKKIEEQPHNVTFSGGDPFLQVEGFIALSKLIKDTGRNIWCYTGYTYEEILSNDRLKPFLHYIDVLVDGKFKMSKKSLDTIFRGSSNQRLINVTKSLEKNEVVLYDYNPYPF